MNFDETYRKYQTRFNSSLENFSNDLVCSPQILRDSLLYSLNLGGKRVRPVLMYAAAELVGRSENVDQFALALELIHTYSLIHDDLPEMDNDDFRRGKPSNHKVFGTGNAVLAGDGLLNTAYEILFNACSQGKQFVAASKYMCNLAGINGMIAGQSADLLHENDKEINEDTLNFIYLHKTAKLIVAALTIPSVLADNKYFTELKAFAEKLGYLFQLTDDVLDVTGEFNKLGKTIGKDEKVNKFTAVRLYGLKNCLLRIDAVGDVCHRILDGIDGNVEFFHEFVEYLKRRVS